ncbi:MAG TPA: hypothetical protein VJV79_38010 [Polyangiaceae bacterium]|nr:hypothetical protein [Polyangiaceae bacterium]
MSFVVRGLLCVAGVAYPCLAQAQSAPAAQPTSSPSLRVYLRSEGAPLTFSTHVESGHGSPTWCISPCDVRLSPGEYQVALNGRAVDGRVALQRPGTLRGEYQSRAASRSAAWLALNLGGVIGGVFVTVGAINGSPAAFAVGGGVLAGATAIFFITYRADRASVSFTPEPPPDVHGIPEPAAMSGSRQAFVEPTAPGSTPRGVGFRIAF